jgi:hypothetical protein
MSSKYLLNSLQNNKSKIMRTVKHEAILFTSALPSLAQQVSDTPASQQNNILPGQTAQFDIKFLAKELRVDNNMSILFSAQTSDGTNLPRTFQEGFAFIDYLSFETNRGSDKIEFNGQDAIWLIISNWIKTNRGENPGLDINQWMNEWRSEIATFTGVQLSGTKQWFFLPLRPFIPFIHDIVTNSVVDGLRINMRFIAAPSNATDACKFIQSSTTSAAYTSSVTFNDITFFRKYTIVNDPRAILQPPLDLQVVPISRFDYKVVATAWNSVGTNRTTFKLSDVSKNPYVQRVHAFVRKLETAYNAADAAKKYSGFKYIVWKVTELNGDRRVLDFTAASTLGQRRLRAREIEYQRRTYGADLPLEVYTDPSGSDLNEYYLSQTCIQFDDISVADSNTEDVISTLDTVRNDTQDYNIEFECAGSVGASCELIIAVEYYDLYKWNKANQLEKQK